MDDPMGREETGSVVGIQFEVAGMYTGTLIEDLMTAVERAEARAQQKRIADEHELYRIYALEIPVTPRDQILMGAA